MDNGVLAIPQQMQRLVGSHVVVEATEWEPIDTVEFDEAFQLDIGQSHADGASRPRLPRRMLS